MANVAGKTDLTHVLLSRQSHANRCFGITDLFHVMVGHVSRKHFKQIIADSHLNCKLPCHRLSGRSARRRSRVFAFPDLAL